MVSLHGCGVIVPERLKNETPVMVKLVSNGASKKGRIVLAVHFWKIFPGCWEWSLIPRETFGRSKILRRTGGPKEAHQCFRNRRPSLET